MPRPPEYCGSAAVMPNSGEKYAMVRGVVGAERLEPARLGEVLAKCRALALGPFDEAVVARELVEPGRVDLAEERHRVALGGAPQLGIDVLEQSTCRLMPRPAQVGGELLEGAQRAGYDGADGELANRLHALHPKSVACRTCERRVATIA